MTYTKLGISVVWIFPFKEPSWVDGEPGICKTQSWHQYFHLMFFGRVYFWQGGRLVRAAHLGKFFRNTPEGNWVEDFENEVGDDLSGTDFYQEKHDEAYYGGGRRFVKSYKAVAWCPQLLDLVRDFRSTDRPAFRTKRYSVPSCRLWIDHLRPWWPKEEFKKSF